jgi:thioredoxin 1
MWLKIVAVAMMPISAGAETVHLKNGKSLEGRILSREADRIWLDTDAGRIPVLLDRVEVVTPETLPEARAAFKAGENQRALRLAQIIVFWAPENEEAGELAKLSLSQIALAAKGRELSAREREAGRVLEAMAARLEAIEPSDTDPATEEEALLEIESELKQTALEYGDTPLQESFDALTERASERTLNAHERKLRKEAFEKTERQLETQRMRAEAIGIRDFFAPVATLTNGGKTLDLEILMVPDGIMIFDFYADWCAPCKELDPLLQTLAKNDEDVYLRRINILDFEKPIARQYDLKAIPSVWVYDGTGELIESRIHWIDGVEAAVQRARQP